MKPELEVRLNSFLNYVRYSIPSFYNVDLRGSWSTEEYHLLYNGRVITSFSDVDFVCEFPSVEIHHKIRKEALCATTEIGIELIGDISLRCRSDMDSMWMLPIAIDSSIARSVREKYICFWIMVAAAETAISYAAKVKNGEWYKYQSTKFFLRVWRTLALADGLPTNSWGRTLQLMEKYLPPEIRLTTMAIKTRSARADNWTNFVVSHFRAISKHHLFVTLKNTNQKLLNDVVAQVVRLEKQNDFPNPYEYICNAEQFMLPFTAQRAAITRLRTKIKQLCHKPLHSFS